MTSVAVSPPALPAEAAAAVAKIEAALAACAEKRKCKVRLTVFNKKLEVIWFTEMPGVPGFMAKIAVSKARSFFAVRQPVSIAVVASLCCLLAVLPRGRWFETVLRRGRSSKRRGCAPRCAATCARGAAGAATKWRWRARSPSSYLALTPRALSSTARHRGRPTWTSPTRWLDLPRAQRPITRAWHARAASSCVRSCGWSLEDCRTQPPPRHD